VRLFRAGAGNTIQKNLHSRFRPVPINKNEVDSEGCRVSSVFERLLAPNTRRYLLKVFHSTFIRITAQVSNLFPCLDKNFEKNANFLHLAPEEVPLQAPRGFAGTVQRMKAS
jgi:hypothetical protein